MKSVLVILMGFYGSINAQPDEEYGLGFHWSYESENQWTGTCRTGRRQSPINILTRDTIVDNVEAHIRGPLLFHGYTTANLKAENNGHTLRWSNVDYPRGPVLSGGPLRGNYTFVELHMHWLSEHAINGMKYALEIHFVHIKQGKMPQDAIASEEGLAVIGVMCELTGDPSSATALKDIIKVVPKLQMKKSKDETIRTTDVTRLFSPNPQSYYTYHGSLTTPECEESVTWIVMDNPIAISDDQYKLITKTDVGTFNNYRSLQPVNRVVYKVTSPANSCTNISAPTFLATLGALVNCFSSYIVKVIKKGTCILYNKKRKLFSLSTNLQECAKAAN